MPTYHQNEWPLEVCRVKQAWKIQLPNHNLGKSKGEGIIIAHPDTGWTEHPELMNGGRYLIHPNDAINFYGNQNDARDTFGLSGSHGTTTASIMKSDEGHPSTLPYRIHVPLDEFVTGIAPKVRIIPLRVTDFVILSANYMRDTNYNSYSALAWAIYYAIHLDSIRYPDLVGVISISLGGLKSNFCHLESALKEARRRGIIVCAAAGQLSNRWMHGNDKGPKYPGSSYHTICVAGCYRNGSKPQEGYYGRMVNITAPGWDMTVARTKKPNLVGWTEYFIDKGRDGTSYSTALVAGACALWLAHHNRALLIKKYGRPLLFDVFRYCLEESCHKPPNWDSNNRGKGILNAEALLQESLLPEVPQAEQYAKDNNWKEEDWGDPIRWGRE
jgi:serine protease